MLLLLSSNNIANAISNGLLTVSQLRCAEPGVDYWYNVLAHGSKVGIAEHPVDGRARRVLYMFYGQQVYAFLFMYPELPGAREPGAWHGCAIYRLYRLPSHRPQ